MRKDDSMNQIGSQQNGPTELQGERAATQPGADRETTLVPVPISSSKRMRSVAIIIPLMIIAGLLLGFFPRWHERRMAIGDMNQLVVPTVSVVSLTPLTMADGLILPAEIRPWREASIYA